MGACGWWGSTAIEDTANVEDAGRDGWEQPRVGDGGKSIVDQTVAHRTEQLLVRALELFAEEKIVFYGGHC